MKQTYNFRRDLQIGNGESLSEYEPGPSIRSNPSFDTYRSVREGGGYSHALRTYAATLQDRLSTGLPYGNKGVTGSVLGEGDKTRLAA